MKEQFKSYFICITTTLCLLLLTSCKESFSPTLRETDKVLFTDREKGEATLDSICNAASNMSATDRRYCQLLRLKADDKAYRPIADKKELIDSLVSYFKYAGDDDLLAETYFYAGRVYYEIGDKPESLKFYQKANEKVSKDNYALQGDIYCQMENVYRYTGMNTEALASLHLAYKADSLAGNKRNMLYDIRDIGETFYNCNQLSKAQTYFQKGIKLAAMRKDSLLLKCFHHELANIYIEYQDWDNALFHVRKYFFNMEDVPDRSGMLSTALETFTQIGNKDLIKLCRQLMFKDGNIFCKQYAAENILTTSAYASQDTTRMSQLSLYIQYTDSVINESHTDAVKKVEQSYNYKLKEEENKYLQTSNFVKSIAIAVAAILVLFCYIYFHLKVSNIKQKQKILELKLDKYKLLKEKNEYKPLDKLTREKQEVKDSAIYKQLITAIDEQTFHLEEGDWKDIKEIINQAYGNFDSNLRGFLDVSLQEYRICLLLKMGFSPTNIAHFVNLTKEAITASRRRMYTKAFNRKGKPSDWDEIIKSL